MRKKTKRVSLVLPKEYLDFVEDLEWRGVYLNKQSAIRAGIRLLMKEHGAFYIYEKTEDVKNA